MKASRVRRRHHAVARANRPTPHTVCWLVCGQTQDANVKAVQHLACRLGDHELADCADRTAITALLDRRRPEWQQMHRLVVVQPAAQSW